MIVVTTPTGTIGRQVVSNLLATGDPVRVIVRDPARLPDRVRAAVEVVTGSHDDPAVVQQAFTGADAVFWLTPVNPRAESLTAAYLDFTRAAAEAVRTRNVSHVVSVSALGRGTPMAADAGYVTASLAMDDLLASTGTGFRALTMPSFMDNVLRQVVPIRQGTFYGPVPADLPAPTCATRDIAAVAAGLLRDPSWSGQAGVPVLGPEDLSFQEMAGIITEVLGRPVTYQQIPGTAFKANLIANGLSEAMAQGTLDMMVAKSRGLDNAEPRTPQSSTPTTFRTWCEEVLQPAVEQD